MNRIRRILSLLCGVGVCSAQIPAGPAAASEPGAGRRLLQQVRAASLDPEQCYRVRDLTLAREDLRLYFTAGYLIFSKPVNGERISAVFTAEVEGGDGEVLLLPPFRGERQSLARFTQSPNLDEHFRAAVLVFTEGSAQTLLDRIAQEGAGRKMPEAGPPLAEQWTPVLAAVESRFDLRLVQDLLAPQPGRAGLLFAAIAGKRLGNFDVLYDLSSQNQISAGRQTGPEKHYAYEIWTNFAARGSRIATARKGTAQALEPAFSEERFQIDASLDANLALKATVRASIKTGPSGLRTLAFDVAHAIEVTSARVDGQPAEIVLSDGPPRGNAVTDAQNGSFLVVPAAQLAPSSTHEVEFEEHGAVISPAGNDVYFVGARANWYPRGEGEGGAAGLALYDLTFRYPKRLTLVTAGEVTEDRIDGDFHVTRRVTQAPLRMAGFNLGDYEETTGDPSARSAHRGVREPAAGGGAATSGSDPAAGRRESGRTGVSPSRTDRAARRSSASAPASAAESSGSVASRGGRYRLRASIFLRLVRAPAAEDLDGVAYSGNVWPRLPRLGVPVHFVLSRPQSAPLRRARSARAGVLLGSDRGARSGAPMVGRRGHTGQLSGRMAL